jgi:hypothetical protein
LRTRGAPGFGVTGQVFFADVSLGLGDEADEFLTVKNPNQTNAD